MGMKEERESGKGKRVVMIMVKCMYETFQEQITKVFIKFHATY